MSSDPLVFISHKHSDREIAEVVGRFIRTRSAGKVRVHLSSSPDFEGPRFGAPLNEELKRALGAADVVILVFTSDSEDWSYCMWECGVATDPSDEHHTAVVAVQCTSAEPKPFSDQLRVDARNLDSLQAFVKALLTTTDFFACLDKPITGFAAEGAEVPEFAADLHAKLADVLPSGAGAERSTPTSPYLRVRLDDSTAEKLRAAYLASAADESGKILESKAVIVESVGASDLFGMKLGPTATLGDVLADWRSRDENIGHEARWFSGLAEQIEAALVGKLRAVKWAPYRTTRGCADVPYVAAARRIADGVEFDLYMVPIVPRPIPVDEKMIPIGQMFFKDATEEAFDGIQLTSLVKVMKERKASRLPLLAGGKPHSVIHKATINEFVVHKLETVDVMALTLQDLLTHHEDKLAISYAEVPPGTSVDDAMEAMAGKPGCQDVYVTKDGMVLGWLANVMFIQN